jgi:hypothetical protein
MTTNLTHFKIGENRQNIEIKTLALVVSLTEEGRN